MSHHRFPTVKRALTSVPSRRNVLRGIAAAGLGLWEARRPELATAKKKCKKKKVICESVCLAGQKQLSNGTCALPCKNSSECPTVCICIGANEEGEDLCGIEFSSTDCSQVPQVCVTTADCPRGQSCLATSCGAGGATENRCLALCAV